MRARHSGRSEYPHHFPIAEWQTPPSRETFSRHTLFEQPWVMVLAVALLIAGAYVNRFTALAIDGMSFMIIFSKSWVVMLLAHGVYTFFSLRRIDNIPPDHDIKQMLGKNPFKNATPVYVRFKKFGVLTGSDFGLAWLDKNSLKFRGGSTAFCLPRSVILPWFLWPAGRKRAIKESEKGWSLPLLGVDDSQTIDIFVLDYAESYGSLRKARAFINSLNVWVRDVSEVPTDGTRLPPDQLHPSLDDPRSTTRLVLVASGLFAAIDLYMLAMPSFPQHLSWISLVDSIGRLGAFWLLCVVGYVVYRCLRAYTVRRDIAQKVGQ